MTGIHHFSTNRKNICAVDKFQSQQLQSAPNKWDNSFRSGVDNILFIARYVQVPLNNNDENKLVVLKESGSQNERLFFTATRLLSAVLFDGICM